MAFSRFRRRRIFTCDNSWMTTCRTRQPPPPMLRRSRAPASPSSGAYVNTIAHVPISSTVELPHPGLSPFPGVDSSYLENSSSDPYALVRKYAAEERAVVGNPRCSLDLIRSDQDCKRLKPCTSEISEGILFPSCTINDWISRIQTSIIVSRVFGTRSSTLTRFR